MSTKEYGVMVRHPKLGERARWLSNREPGYTGLRVHACRYPTIEKAQESALKHGKENPEFAFAAAEFTK